MELTRRGKKLEYWLSKRIGRAMGDFNMLNEGDKILIAVSGGKDSMTLLNMMVQRQHRIPVKHELVVLHVVSNYNCGGALDEERLEEYFRKLGVEYYFEYMDISLKINDKKIGSNCFWCAWNRRKIFFEYARKLNCSKIALGHHKDDIVQTTLMNLLFQGEISTMIPKQPFFGGEFHIIRPLCYVDEELIKEYAGEAYFTESLCNCPVGKHSNRNMVKEFIAHVQTICPGVKNNIFYAPGRINEEYLPDFKVPENENEEKA